MGRRLDQALSEPPGRSRDAPSPCRATPRTLQRDTFPQEATGSMDLVTGEGSTAPDGRTSRGFTTAGFSASGVKAEWLASTVSHRVD